MNTIDDHFEHLKAEYRRKGWTDMHRDVYQIEPTLNPEFIDAYDLGQELAHCGEPQPPKHTIAITER